MKKQEKSQWKIFDFLRKNSIKLHEKKKMGIMEGNPLVKLVEREGKSV